MRIKNKFQFCIGIIDIILGVICAVMLGLGYGTETRAFAAVICTLVGFNAILDSIESKED